MKDEDNNKEFKKKGFYFKDYTESDIVVKNKDTKLVKVSLNRITFLSFIFFSLILIFSIKIIYLSLSPDKNFFLENINQDFVKERRDIVDRNGIIIARNIGIYSAGIRPQLAKDKGKLLLNLRLILPELESNKIKNKLNHNKFFYLKRRLTEEEKTNLWLLGNKAIVFEKKKFRIYPQKNLFSHVLGQIDDNNIGISGIEKFFDQDLKNKELVNFSLDLTLDSNLQYLIRKELINAQADFNAVGSAALLMDVDNGEILSLVSLPDYDLNKRFSINEDIYTNKITKGVYELGSVFKTFTLAAALESNVINSNTMFKNLDKKIFCAGREISEHDELPQNLSAEQILIRSSNIGAIRIAQMVGIKKYKDFLNSLELFKKIDFDFEEIGTPLPFRWGKCKLATSSFGHGVTTTPLQLARAYAILGNGGYKIRPTILRKKLNPPEQKIQIISSETSDTINSILRKVVANKEGTANFANIKGYEVGGKTGSALKSSDGIYTKKNLILLYHYFQLADQNMFCL
ncbi:MAG: penicillin-binding protein 2 [Pelagibacteraceae bacterium]|nr:penicillin-binding protein 2 [Pelagibacteraceae bacterium]